MCIIEAICQEVQKSRHQKSWLDRQLTRSREGVQIQNKIATIDKAGNTKGGSNTVPLTSCLTGLESAVWQLTISDFLLAKQTNPNQSNRRSMVLWYFPL